MSPTHIKHCHILERKKNIQLMNVQVTSENHITRHVTHW